MDWRFPESPRAPDYAALRVRCVARANGGGRRGSHKTRLFEPQTSYDSFSRQPCATRPRKRDETRVRTPPCEHVDRSHTLRVGAPDWTLCVRARLLRCARLPVSRKRCLLRLLPAHAARQFAVRCIRACQGWHRYAHPALARSIRRCRGCRRAWVRCRAF